MSKELTDLKDNLLAKLREARADTSAKLKQANALYESIRAKIAELQKESAEASRLLNVALKNDMDAAKELRALEGGERTYKPPTPAAPKEERVRSHRRIVRARNMPPPMMKV
jgi:chromosome segregation ATPase